LPAPERGAAMMRPDAIKRLKVFASFYKKKFFFGKKNQKTSVPLP
jgi:hypothetical protein